MVSNSCSPTSRWFLQQLPDIVGMLVTVCMLLGNVHARQPFLRLVVQRCADERHEQRMRPGGSALELRVRLGADEERMDIGAVLDDLDQMSVRRRAGETQPALRDAVAILVVDL